MAAGLVLGLSLAPLAKESLDLIHELRDVFEFPVHGSEAHIRDLIELVELGHDLLTHHAARDLGLAPLLDSLLDAVCDGLQRRHADRAFLTGFLQAGQHLGPVEGFPPPVFLDDHGEHFLDPLVGGEPPLAPQALPAPADGLAFLRHPRVHDLIFNVATERASHRRPPSPYRYFAKTGNFPHKARMRERTSRRTVWSCGCERTLSMASAISSISFSRMPRVVTIGVPSLMPLAMAGGFSSNGIAFLLTVMPASSSAASASLPVIPFVVTSTSIRWVSVPPDTIRRPRFWRPVARALAFATTCCWYFLKPGESASFRATALAAMTCINGPPWRPGKTAFSSHLSHRVVIDALGGPIHAIGIGAIENAGEADAAPMSEVAAMGQIHTQDRVSRLEDREVDGHVGLRPRMGLDVHMVRAEDLLGALDRQRLDHVHVLAAPIVAATRIALSVLVGHDRALRGQDRRAGEVLRRDQQDLVSLATALLADGLVDLGIGRLQRVRHGCVSLPCRRPARRRRLRP